MGINRWLIRNIFQQEIAFCEISPIMDFVDKYPALLIDVDTNFVRKYIILQYFYSQLN